MNVIDLAAARARRHPQHHPHREAHEAAFRELTEAAAKAYRAAAKARAAGDETGAALIVNAAWQALDQAHEIGEQIALLG